VFRSACNDLATLASKAKPDPETLAERVFAAITDNGYGIFDNLVETVFPALGETGVARLESKLDAALADCPNKGAKHDRRANSLRRALKDLASAEGNVDRYIALVPADDRKQPGIAARIGRKLLNAGRAAEALVALENGAPKQRGSYLNDDLYHPGYEGRWIEWEDAYLDALDATGQTERAQLILGCLRRAALCPTAARLCQSSTGLRRHRRRRKGRDPRARIQELLVGPVFLR
jgi:hypothetical protein